MASYVYLSNLQETLMDCVGCIQTAHSAMKTEVEINDGKTYPENENHWIDILSTLAKIETEAKSVANEISSSMKVN